MRVTLSEMKRDGRVAFSDKTEAFREFILKWRAATDAPSQTNVFTDAALLASMAPPPGEDRMVLLLTDVVGFSQREVEQILAPLSRSYEDLIAAGRQIVGARRNASAVIVEDEPLIAADLRALLEEIGVSVAGVARSADEGAALTAKARPDVVLADYNLEGQKTGVDAILAMQETHRCPVVFITGYPDKVLAGEEVEPDFVIVKPYRPEAVRAAVAHCLETARISVIE